MPSKTIELTADDGGRFAAYLSLPEASKAPVVVILQEIFGVNANIRGTADNFAKAGFIAIAPDLFWRQEPGVELDATTEEGREKATTLMKGMDQGLAVKDALAAMRHALSLPQSNGKAGAVGYCLGGMLAYRMAQQPGVDAAVSYYGVGIQGALDQAADVKGRLLLHVAADDHLCPPEAQAKIAEAMAGRDNIIIVTHPGVGHAFARLNSPARNEAAAQKADAATIDLLREALGAEMSAHAPPVSDAAGGTLDRALADLKVSAYGLAVMVLCVLVSMIEGYDVQVMALAAPLMRSAWGLEASQIAILLAASVIGLVAGSFLLSPLGDRVGRKPAIVLGLAIAGVFTFAGAHMPNIPTLLGARFGAGVGLGLALPVTLTLAMEVMPARLRTVVIVIVMCGLPLGGAVGSWAAGEMVRGHGYQVVFWFGGLGAGVAALICFLALPESPFILARRPQAHERLRRLLQRLGAAVPEGELTLATRQAAPKSTVAALFTPERRTATLLLWLINFANLAMVYFFFNWMPSLLMHKGLTPDMAIKYTALFSAGGVVGGVALALSMRRFGPTVVLAAAYIVSIGAVLVLAMPGEVGTLFGAAIFVSGAVIVGSQFCLTAVVNQYYPPEIRVTGGGYATGAGRAGAIAAPLAGGAIVAAVASPEQAFLVTTAPALVCLAAIIVLWRTRLLAGAVPSRT